MTFSQRIFNPDEQDYIFHYDEKWEIDNYIGFTIKHQFTNIKINFDDFKILKNLIQKLLKQLLIQQEC